MTSEQKEVLVEVTKQFLAERCFTYGEYRRKCMHHARSGNVHYLKKYLERAGVDTTRLDAIMPLIHG